MEFKCKSCGSMLNCFEGQIIVKCEHCGNSQFIFDFLDKDSNYYKRNLKMIEVEREKFEQKYFEFSDDIINADSYCLSSSKLKEIINFFTLAKDYKESVKYLELAKIEFMRHVESYEDCVLAKKYVNDISSANIDEKNELLMSISNIATVYRHKDLVKAGYAVLIENYPSEDNLLSLLKNLSEVSSKDISEFNECDIEIIKNSKRSALLWIDNNGAEIIRNSTSIEKLTQIRMYISDLEDKCPISKKSELQNYINDRIRFLEQEEKDRIHKCKEKENKAKIKKFLIIISVVLVALIVVIVIISALISKNNGYSAKNISISVISKNNIKYNENLADGQIGAGYYYDFGFSVKNNSANDIRLIRGTMEIIDSQGISLATTTLEIHEKLKAESSAIWKIQLNVGKGNNARKIWNSSLEELKITFKITSIYFSDGTNRSYDMKSIVVHEISE